MLHQPPTSSAVGIGDKQCAVLASVIELSNILSREVHTDIAVNSVPFHC